MSGQDRIVRILEILGAEGHSVTPESLMRALGVSRATIFRDLQPLVRAGLVERLDPVGYSLGPRIVALDRQIRLHDPLLQAAGELPAELVRQTRGSVLICRLHGRSVMCIDAREGALGEHPLSYQRGRAMPLYRGATSQVILACLEAAQIEAMLREDQAAWIAAGLPATLEDALGLFQAWRQAGCVVSHGAIDAGMTGLAVPILLGPRVLGSLSVVLPTDKAGPVDQQRSINLLRSAARRIEARLTSLGSSPD